MAASLGDAAGDMWPRVRIASGAICSRVTTPFLGARGRHVATHPRRPPAAEPRHREQPSGEEFPPSHRPAASPAAGMCQLLLLLLALAALPCGTDGQLDASWTPSGDGPLPLSDNYRSTLRKLCRLLDKDKLPPKLASSHSTIVRQCGQLAEADAAGGGAAGGDSAIPGWVLGVGVVVVAGAMLADRAGAGRGMASGGQALGGAASGTTAGVDDAAVRAQRAKFLDKLGGSSSGGTGSGADLAESLRQRITRWKLMLLLRRHLLR